MPGLKSGVDRTLVSVVDDQDLAVGDVTVGGRADCVCGQPRLDDDKLGPGEGEVVGEFMDGVTWVYPCEPGAGTDDGQVEGVV